MVETSRVCQGSECKLDQKKLKLKKEKRKKNLNISYSWITVGFLKKIYAFLYINRVEENPV